MTILGWRALGKPQLVGEVAHRAHRLVVDRPSATRRSGRHPQRAPYLLGAQVTPSRNPFQVAHHDRFFPARARHLGVGHLRVSTVFHHAVAAHFVRQLSHVSALPRASPEGTTDCAGAARRRNSHRNTHHFMSYPSATMYARPRATPRACSRCSLRSPETRVWDASTSRCGGCGSTGMIFRRPSPFSTPNDLCPGKGNQL